MRDEYGSWTARDERFRVVDDHTLRVLLAEAEERMTLGFGRLTALGPSTVIPNGGWGFSVAHLVIHMREEFALHRWDLIGDDSISSDLLAQPEFLNHSVDLLDRWLLARGLARDPSPAISFHARLRCQGQPDVVVRTKNRSGSLSFAAPVNDVDLVETDAAGRLLLIWGRQPSDSRRVLSTMPSDHLERFCTLLSGF